MRSDRLATLRKPLLIALAVFTLPAGTALAADPPREATAEWWSQVREEIQDREYDVTWQDETTIEDLQQGWHAPNRAHDLRTYFTRRGIRVVPRTETTPSWEWRLSLIGYGRGGDVRPVSEAVLSTRGHRIDYDRGDVREWYVNGRRGLKQGFTLDVRPEEAGAVNHAGRGCVGARTRRVGQDDGTHAYLVLRLDGDLSPRIAEGGQAVGFVAPGGARVLNYQALKVYDARGDVLAAHMEGFAQAGVRGLRIVFDDRQAVYPVTVDPLATTPSWTDEGDQVDAEFGYSVATAGDVNGDGYSDVVIGAQAYDDGQHNEGRAFVYHGSSSGLSVAPAWMDEGDKELAYFGHDVAAAGDVDGDGYGDLVVSAYIYDGEEENEGRVHVYHGSSSGLSSDPEWTAEGNQAYARFGESVSTAGDVNGDGYSDVLVGADGYDNGEDGEGRAYLYLGSASGLSAPDWSAEGDQEYAGFGVSVSTAGDVNADGYADVVVGANEYGSGQDDEGRAYVYHGSASGLSPAPAWTTTSDQAGAELGTSVSAAGDVDGDGYGDVLVGAPFFDAGETDEGRVFLYRGSPSGLLGMHSWSAEGNQPDAEFGFAVSTAGDVDGDGYADVIVGAPELDAGESDEGRTYVYTGSENGLSSTPEWMREGNQNNAEFGETVSTAGDVDGDGYSDIVVGARLYDAGESDEGRAFVYRGSAAGLAPSAGWTAESDESDAGFGHSVSTAGDVNGDGYGDLIVGARGFDGGAAGAGAAFVYHGSSTGPAHEASWVVESHQAGARFGESVSSAGDVDGDGYDDVIVGAYLYENDEGDVGAAFVYHGSSAGLSSSADWSDEGGKDDGHFGGTVSTAGDVNGDGYADVIVGADNEDSNVESEGRAYVYHGSAEGLSGSADWTVDESDQINASFGFAVSNVGDVNRDGYADVIVGAWSYDGDVLEEGRAYVYHGSAAGLSTSADWTSDGDDFGAHFGFSVSTAGDVNGDGYADAIVGADDYDNGETREGRAFVYHGSANGLSSTANWTAEGNQAEAHFGVSVSTAGDVDGDGFADVVIGAHEYDDDASDEGRVFFYLGSSAGLSSTADWAVGSNQAAAGFGQSVATAGDVNGDGYADVLVGADLYDDGEDDEGRAFLYYGNEGPGLSLVPQQRQVNDSAPIAHLGKSDDEERFRVAVHRARTPFGRGNVKLEIEVEELGTPFSGAPGTVVSEEYVDTGTGGVELSVLAPPLDSGKPYHWRARLHYDPITSPHTQRSRWFTVPRNGWEESDLRTGGWDVTCNVTDLMYPDASDEDRFTWTGLMGCATGFDTARLDVQTMRGMGGDYSSATCIENDDEDTETTDTSTPTPGSAFGYLVRGDGQSYNTRSDSQKVDRDASLTACPVAGGM